MIFAVANIALSPGIARSSFIGNIKMIDNHVNTLALHDAGFTFFTECKPKVNTYITHSEVYNTYQI